MSEMDPQRVREWKAGYDEMNRFVDEERRRATPAERYGSLKQIWAMARELHLFKPKETDIEVFARWQRLRAAYLRTHGPVS